MRNYGKWLKKLSRVQAVDNNLIIAIEVWSKLAFIPNNMITKDQLELCNNAAKIILEYMDGIKI